MKCRIIVLHKRIYGDTKSKQEARLVELNLFSNTSIVLCLSWKLQMYGIIEHLQNSHDKIFIKPQLT